MDSYKQIWKYTEEKKGELTSLFHNSYLVPFRAAMLHDCNNKTAN